MKMKTFTHWLHGLISAFIGGAATAISTCVVAPEKFNFGTGWKNLLTVSAISGIVTVAAYLKQSPLPPEDDEPEVKP